jgi:hypothetical protein
MDKSQTPSLLGYAVGSILGISLLLNAFALVLH